MFGEFYYYYFQFDLSDKLDNLFHCFEIEKLFSQRLNGPNVKTFLPKNKSKIINICDYSHWWQQLEKYSIFSTENKCSSKI